MSLDTHLTDKAFALEGELLPPGPVLDYWPHPITADGRKPIVAFEGQTLAEAFAGRIPPGMAAHAVVNGALVAQSEWGGIVLHRDDLVQVRVRVHGGGGGSNPIAVVLSLAIIIAAPYLAGALIGVPGAAVISGAAGFGATLLSAGIAVGGLLAVSALFPPRLPDPPGAVGQPDPQYSLSGGANRARPHEPLLMLLGSHRMYPDIVASEYTEYDENSDQFLNGIYDFGIGNLEIGPPRFGETPLSNFNSVSQQKQVNAITLVAGNVDTIAGGEFEAAYPNGRATGSPWITRRTAANTTSISFDLVSMHFIATNRGDLEGRTAFFQVQWREVGDSGWLFQNVDIVSPDGADARNAVRRTISTGRLDAAAYDVRVRIRANYDDDEDLSRITYRAAAPTIKAHQDETADFTGRNALALRVKATGQLYGRLDRINADVGAQVPDWGRHGLGYRSGDLQPGLHPAVVAPGIPRREHAQGRLRTDRRPDRLYLAAALARLLCAAGPSSANNRDLGHQERRPDRDADRAMRLGAARHLDRQVRRGLRGCRPPGDRHHQPCEHRRRLDRHLLRQ